MVLPGEDVRRYTEDQMMNYKCEWEMKTFSKSFESIHLGRKFSIKLCNQQIIEEGIRDYLLPLIQFYQYLTEDNLKRCIKSSNA
jgi:hypothetical protein